jgi:hypothetical protein
MFRTVVIRTFVLVLSIVAVQGAFATIIATETQSSLPITDDFESYSAGRFDAPSGINGGTAGESFDGQTVDDGSGFDVVTGSPSNPLTVATATLENLYISTPSTGGQVIAGSTPTGNDEGGIGIGEGAVTFLFDSDHTEMGIRIAGNSISGQVTFQFFNRTGGSVGSTTVTTTLDNPDVTLVSESGAFAGVTITNTDPAGVGYDDLRVGEAAPPEPEEPTIPVPTLSAWATYLLVASLALFGWLAVRRRLTL